MPNTTHQTIFDYIKAQEVLYKKPIELVSNWRWGMQEHVRKVVTYKHSQLLRGKDEWTPVRNIMKPILMLQYFAEGFDVKDVLLFINNSKKYFKSFLVRKFHDEWAVENKIDTVIDESVESYVDYGLVLLKNSGARPEVVPLQSIVFCDQADILSGPIGIKHYFSHSELMEMKSKGWGKRERGATITLEQLITLSRDYKTSTDVSGTLTITPGKYIEVYEIHGSLPETFMEGSDATKYSQQFHIVAFYQLENTSKQGVTLFSAKETELPFKALKRDPIYGRACGFGGVEELEEAQVWSNYGMLLMKNMLDSASKVVMKTTDASVARRNNIKDIDNLEIIELEEGKDLSQVDTFPRNYNLFDRSIADWEDHAKLISGAPDPLLGQEPSSGTPFKLQDLVVQTGKGPHDYRRGKLAVFWGELYSDWILPHIKRDITKGKEFLAELDFEELQYVADSLVQCEANNMVREKILNGEMIDPNEIEGYKEIVRGEFMKKGNKHFIKILKDELRDIPVKVRPNIVGKQKDVRGQVDKLVNVFRTVAANPEILQSKPMADLFNQILEASDLEPIDFSGFMSVPIQQQMQPQVTSQSRPMPQPEMAQMQNAY